MGWERMKSNGLFGQETELLKSKLVDVIVAAHDRHVEAQEVSGQPGQGVYAQLWRALPAVCTEAVRSQWASVETVQPGRAGYRLPVLQDTVIFPWRPPHGGDPAITPFITSPSRAQLFALKPNAQAMLDLDGIDPNSSDDDFEGSLNEVVELAAERHLRVVMVAVESDASRLRRITWGVVEPAIDDSTVRFYGIEPLLIRDEAALEPSVSDMAATQALSDEHTFASGPAPQRIVKKRETGTDDK